MTEIAQCPPWGKTARGPIAALRFHKHQPPSTALNSDGVSESAESELPGPFSSRMGCDLSRL